MQQETDDSRSRAAREAELSEVLSSYVEPRAVGYSFVVGFVVVGLLFCVSVAWAASQRGPQVPFRLQEAMPAVFERGVAAYRRGEWDEALRLMLRARNDVRQPNGRIEDYINRLELIRRDGERLSRAEEALAADNPERALALAGMVAPNSPLFPQAELLGRNARSHSAPTTRVLAPAAVSETEQAQPERQAYPGRTASPARRRLHVPDPKPVDFDHEW